MAYFRKDLVARRAYSGLSGLVDDLKQAATSIVDFYGSAKKTQGANEALQQQQAAAAVMPSPGIDIKTVAVVGAIGLGAFLLLKKKRSQ